MKLILRAIYYLHYIVSRSFYKVIVMPIKKSMLAECGKNVTIDRGGAYCYRNTYIGDDVSISYDVSFINSRAKIKIGNKVMIGHHVFITTGGHQTNMIGRYMVDIKDNEKTTEYDDKDVIINDDVWIAPNVTILGGVIIGSGSIVATGSIVNKNVEPYSIVAGAPAKVIKIRFTEEEIEKHKNLLGQS